MRVEVDMFPDMFSADDLDRLRDHISRSVADQLLQDSSINWTNLQRLDKPVLCIQARLQDGATHEPAEMGMFSHIVDLTGIATPSGGTPEGNATAPTSEAKAPPQRVKKRKLSNRDEAPDNGRITPPEDDDEGAAPSSQASTAESSAAGQQRRAISGLRPVQATTEVEEAGSQRQIHSGDKFPKRRKHQPEGHVLRPSSLDKLIQGIWKQIHGSSLDLQPRNLLELVQPRGMERTTTSHAMISGAPLVNDTAKEGVLVNDKGSTSTFKQNNIFCSKITQASRTCRSLEVIVQARWVEHFDAYVDSLQAASTAGMAHQHHVLPTARPRFNKAALTSACTDFGWSEKDLRNKMAIWRGYAEIKQAGGWAALIFAGTGVYRFCKYRVGFDAVSMARLRCLRPAFEVTADTLQPGWRSLLAAVGSASETSRVYTGHPHDHVVSLDGGNPVPLRLTYLKWDPAFSFRHLDECVVDTHAWPGDDPRWTVPALNASGLPTCEACDGVQSDDPGMNACLCFPTLFGGGGPAPNAPVLVFVTPDGRNNGLLALCAFERGTAVGEFVGRITKGLAEVDVMEGGGTSTKEGGGVPTPRYQIWQGREGNFTRFVNHSCRANAQYQRFKWLGVQRTILVSKGIAAGEEVTVDYSDKYWKGLDKICLCGQSCCRYRRADREGGR